MSDIKRKIPPRLPVPVPVCKNHRPRKRHLRARRPQKNLVKASTRNVIQKASLGPSFRKASPHLLTFLRLWLQLVAQSFGSLDI